MQNNISFESGEQRLKSLTLGQFSEITGIAVPPYINSAMPVKGVKGHTDNLNAGEIMLITPFYPEDEQIATALQKGAAIIVVNENKALKYQNYINIIPVSNVLDVSAKFTSWVVSLFPAKRIAITGSIGKTTTTGLLNSILTEAMSTLTHDSMANSHGAVLRTVQRLKDTHQAYVQEVGGAFPGYVEASAVGLKPDILILTNINASHLDHYKTLEGILYDKISLERHMSDSGCVFMDYDDPLLRSAHKTHRVISYGINSPDLDYFAENIKTQIDGISFDFVDKAGNRYPIKLGILGEHNVRNALAAISVALYMGVPMEQIVHSIAKYRTEGIRQNFCNIGGYHMLIDCFNSSKESLLASAKTLMSIPLSDGGRHILFMGHIDRLGDTSKEIHEEIGRELASLNIEQIVFYYGDTIYSYKAAKENGVKQAIFIANREELVEWMRDNITIRDIALYKGGQLASRFPLAIDEVYGTEFQKCAQRANQIRFEENNFLAATVTDVLQINGYIGSPKYIKIPPAIKGRPVKRIAANAFTKQRALEEIVFPDSVNHIGEGAFYVCPRLAKVHLPSQLRYIGRSAFNYCIALKNIHLPQGTIHIERRAFYDCRSLETIYIPDSVGYIGEEAFDNCEKLTIICPLDSYAQKYAEKEKIPYKNFGVD